MCSRLYFAFGYYVTRASGVLDQIRSCEYPYDDFATICSLIGF